MNCRLDNVTVTSKDGKQSILEQVSKITISINILSNHYTKKNNLYSSYHKIL